MRGLKYVAALCVFSAGLFAADNPFIGTWKLNPAKSKFAPGTEFKEATVTFEAVGDQVKRVLHGTGADGQTIHQEGTILWDGKDHKIDEADGAPITVAVTKIDAKTLDVKVKQAGKVIETVKASVSSDGKTMTAISKGEGPGGIKIDNEEVLEKQ